MRPEVKKWYNHVPRNPKTVQQGAEKWKILSTTRPEVQNGTARTEKLIIKEPTKSIFTNPPKI